MDGVSFFFSFLIPRFSPSFQKANHFSLQHQGEVWNNPPAFCYELKIILDKRRWLNLSALCLEADSWSTVKEWLHNTTAHIKFSASSPLCDTHATEQTVHGEGEQIFSQRTELGAAHFPLCKVDIFYRLNSIEVNCELNILHPQPSPSNIPVLLNTLTKSSSDYI